MLSRNPVIISGRLAGNKILVMYFQREKPKTRATFLWSTGMELTPKAVLMSVGQMQVMREHDDLCLACQMLQRLEPGSRTVVRPVHEDVVANER